MPPHNSHSYTQVAPPTPLHTWTTPRFNKSLGVSGKVGTVMMAITGSFFLIAEKVIYVYKCILNCINITRPHNRRPKSMHPRPCVCGIHNTTHKSTTNTPLCFMHDPTTHFNLRTANTHTSVYVSYMTQPHTHTLFRLSWTRSGTRTPTASRRWRARRRRRRRGSWPRCVSVGVGGSIDGGLGGGGCVVVAA